MRQSTEYRLLLKSQSENGLQITEKNRKNASILLNENLIHSLGIAQKGPLKGQERALITGYGEDRLKELEEKRIQTRRFRITAGIAAVAALASVLGLFFR
jgi:hypothetical protein